MNYPINEFEAARFLGVAVQTLRNWRHFGKGPVYYKMGRRVVYDPADIERFKNDSRVEPKRQS